MQYKVISLKVVSGGSELLVRGVTRFDLFLINRDVVIILMFDKMLSSPCGPDDVKILSVCHHSDDFGMLYS